MVAGRAWSLSNLLMLYIRVFHTVFCSKYNCLVHMIPSSPGVHGPGQGSVLNTNRTASEF